MDRGMPLYDQFLCMTSHSHGLNICSNIRHILCLYLIPPDWPLTNQMTQIYWVFHFTYHFYHNFNTNKGLVLEIGDIPVDTSTGLARKTKQPWGSSHFSDILPLTHPDSRTISKTPSSKDHQERVIESILLSRSPSVSFLCGAWGI